MLSTDSNRCIAPLAMLAGSKASEIIEFSINAFDFDIEFFVLHRFW